MNVLKLVTISKTLTILIFKPVLRCRILIMVILDITILLMQYYTTVMAISPGYLEYVGAVCGGGQLV